MKIKDLTKLDEKTLMRLKQTAGMVFKPNATKYSNKEDLYKLDQGTNKFIKTTVDRQEQMNSAYYTTMDGMLNKYELKDQRVQTVLSTLEANNKFNRDQGKLLDHTGAVISTQEEREINLEAAKQAQRDFAAEKAKGTAALNKRKAAATPSVEATEENA